MSTPPHSRPANAPPPPGNILVIRGGAIGDFILTLPVLAALRHHYPDARLAVLGRPHTADLALEGGLADEVRSIEDRRLTGFFVRDGNLHPEFASFFARFDLVVSYLYDPDGVFRTKLARCSGARLIAGPYRPDESLPLHATELFLKPLKKLGIVGADPVPRLRLGAHHTPLTPEPGTSRPTVALHPGSGSERKNWPERKWNELVSRLLGKTSLDLLLVGGEAEGARLDRLAAGRSSPRLHLAQHLPLVELSLRLSDCVAFVGHDSGISHLAAALCLPGVLLWGDSAEAVWRPRSDRCMLLRDPRGLGQISVERVLAALCRLAEGSGLRKCAAPSLTSRLGRSPPFPVPHRWLHPPTRRTPLILFSSLSRFTPSELRLPSIVIAVFSILGVSFGTRVSGRPSGRLRSPVHPCQRDPGAIRSHALKEKLGTNPAVERWEYRLVDYRRCIRGLPRCDNAETHRLGHRVICPGRNGSPMPFLARST